MRGRAHHCGSGEGAHAEEGGRWVRQQNQSSNKKQRINHHVPLTFDRTTVPGEGIVYHFRTVLS
eukprot:scaffold2040_cov196-Alexandrium_tamarense.AAC.12